MADDAARREGHVDPSARVHPGARLAQGVSVGPLSVVGEQVELGPGSEVVAQATLLGPARFGAHTVVYPYATLGAAPQDKSHRGELTRLEVGSGCTFREQVTVHRGTLKGGGITRIGDRAWLMVGAHVAHDCTLGDDVVLTNLATLGGHVTLADRVVVGGHVAIAPFVRVGRAAFVAAGARVERDVPPFVIAAGDRARVRALNRVGLERLGAAPASVAALEATFALVWGPRGAFDRGREIAAREHGADPLVAELLAALAAPPRDRPSSR